MIEVKDECLDYVETMSRLGGGACQLWDSMRYREEYAPFLLSGYVWASRIAMSIAAVFILALALNWSSPTAFGAASSHFGSPSSSIAAMTADGHGIVEATYGAGEYTSCDEDESAPLEHSGTCKGCCSFAGCGGFITPVVAIADYPDFHAQFPRVAIAAPHNLLFPPVTRPPIFTFRK